MRAHFTTTALAKRTDRKHQPPNAQSDYVTYASERLQWSKPLFALALFTGLRRSDLRLLKWTSDLSATKRLVARRSREITYEKCIDVSIAAIVAQWTLEDLPSAIHG